MPTHTSAAPRATTNITARLDTWSDTQPIGHCSRIEPARGAARNIAIRESGTPADTAYTAPSPISTPADIPPQNELTTPVGTCAASCRKVRGSGTPSGGLLDADSVTGTSDADTRIEETTNNSKPSVSAASSRNCPAAIPPIENTM